MSELMSEFKLKIEGEPESPDKLKNVKNDNIISFNTEDALKNKGITPSVVPTFSLVPENHPILRQVLPEFDFNNLPIGLNPNQFASSLVETCRKYNGYGLSANQCGFAYRVFVMGTADQYVAFFNPSVYKTEGEIHLQESCLSFPGLGLYITRPEKIWIKYQDFNGEHKTAHFIGISARCFLHELDHMNGIVYTDKVKPLALKQGMKKRTKILKMVEKLSKNAKYIESRVGNGDAN